MTYIDGVIANDANTSAIVRGAIHIDGITEQDYNTLVAAFPELTITYNKKYLGFEDSRVWEICAYNWGETYDQRPVLVSLADGRRYLYVDGVDAGRAWETTRVFDLSGDAPVRVPMNRRMTRRGDVDEDFAEAERGPIMIDGKRDKGFAVMADPEDFYMTRLNQVTGKAELCQCRVGADGTPEVLWVQGES